MTEVVTIGNATLYCGDCRDVLPTLGRFDAVITDYIIKHVKSTARKHQSQLAGGGPLGDEARGNRADVSHGGAVTGGSSGALRRGAGGDVQGVAADRDQGEIQGQNGRGERSLSARNGEHALSQENRQAAVQSLRLQGSTFGASQERGSLRQQEGESGSAVLALPHESSQKGVLGEAQSFVLITDPPYEIRKKFGVSDLYGSRRMQFHFDEVGITDAVVLPAIQAALERATAFHIFCDPEQYAGLAAIARALGFTPKPWAKQKLCSPPPMPGNWWPSAFELAMYGYKPGAYFGDQSGTRKNMMVFDSYRHGIRAGEKVDHPTQKWLPMMAYLVNTIVPPSGTVIDPFMGSGTTGVAAIQLGRSFIGIERERKYFDIACSRIERAQAQGRLIPHEMPKQVQESLV